jgi:hypothetical protein
MVTVTVPSHSKRDKRECVGWIEIGIGLGGGGGGVDWGYTHVVKVS